MKNWGIVKSMAVESVMMTSLWRHHKWIEKVISRSRDLVVYFPFLVFGRRQQETGHDFTAYLIYKFRLMYLMHMSQHIYFVSFWEACHMFLGFVARNQHVTDFTMWRDMTWRFLRVMRLPCPVAEWHLVLYEPNTASLELSQTNTVTNWVLTYSLADRSGRAV
jgi:hypothetical protein